jgi:hypothetical protein
VRHEARGLCTNLQSLGRAQRPSGRSRSIADTVNAPHPAAATIMRTTRAIHAVERLKTRSGNPQFAAISLSGGLFYLVDKSSGTDKKVSDPLTLDDFVKFVDGFGPPKPRKASKLDLAFEEQIRKSKS